MKISEFGCGGTSYGVDGVWEVGYYMRTVIDNDGNVVDRLDIETRVKVSGSEQEPIGENCRL